MPQETPPPRPSLRPTLRTSPPPPASQREKVPKGLGRLPRGWPLRGRRGGRSLRRVLRGAAGLPSAPSARSCLAATSEVRSHTAGQGKGLDRHPPCQPFLQVTDKGRVPAAPASGEQCRHPGVSGLPRTAGPTTVPKWERFSEMFRTVPRATPGKRHGPPRHFLGVLLSSSDVNLRLQH